MRSFGNDSVEPRLNDLGAAMQKAAQDLLPFTVACLRDSLRAEALTLELVLLALENSWIGFAVSSGEEFTHREFREEIFALVWKRACADLAEGRSTPNLAYTETSMPFYQLGLEERAALQLRMKGKFTYDQIARIMSSTPDECERWVESARGRILGRKIAKDEAEQDGSERGGHSNA